MNTHALALLPADLSKRLLNEDPLGQQIRKEHARLDCTISATKRWGNLTAVTFLIILLRSGVVRNPSADYFKLYRALADTLAIAIISRGLEYFSIDIVSLIFELVATPTFTIRQNVRYSVNKSEFIFFVHKRAMMLLSSISQFGHITNEVNSEEYPELLRIIGTPPTTRNEDGSLSRYATLGIKSIENKIKLYLKKPDSPSHRLRKSFL